MKNSKIKRKKTRQIAVGKVKIGGSAPITVQSMTNTPTQDIAATVAQIVRLQEAGCEIVRVAVPDQDAAEALTAIKEQIDIPLIADIHFNYRLAIAAAKAGADGLRLNPGNIGGIKKVKAVVDCAKEYNIPIRIGVNSGSLEKDILKKYNGVTPAGMVESGLRHVELLKSLDFHQIKISLKASDVQRTVEAYRLLSAKTDLPLHVGVTEAGALYSGVVKSALGIGMLIVEQVEKALMTTAEPLKIAIMGWQWGPF
jgi:(E)-4-hydroxy-3-methylbut-2-enyl-diphosphate synthase